MRRAAVLTACLALAGCGGSQASPDSTSTSASKARSACAQFTGQEKAACEDGNSAAQSDTAGTPATTTATTATTTPQASSPYPVVHWTSTSQFPIQAQIQDIKLDPSGFTGDGHGAAPPGMSYLMVEIAVTDESDRGTGAEELNVGCWWPGTSQINSASGGFESPPGSPTLVLAAVTPLPAYQAEIWGADWLVPENTDPTRVGCQLTTPQSDTLKLT